MRALSVLLLSAVLSAGLPAALSGQGIDVSMAERAPRFLLAASPAPVALDVKRTPMLQRRISLDLNGVTVQEALDAIAQQAGLRLMYSGMVRLGGRTVHLRAAEISVAGALSTVLFDAGVDVLFERDGLAALVLRPPGPVTGVVVGQVLDAVTGSALEGTIVTLEGTTHVATTDQSGMYRIPNVAVGTYRARARRIGYSPAHQQVTVEDEQEVRVDFMLRPQPHLMDEIVVAGTVAETRRRELPVPVAVIADEALQVPSRIQIDQLFRGEVPGVIGYNSGPLNAADSYMFVRGRASFSLENLVKIYIDGVEAPSTSTLSAIDLRNIKRMELLRGPQATSIYGSNASGGVLLIFTKEGAPGSPRLSGSASVGTVASDFVSDAATVMEHRLSIAGGTQGVTYSVGGSFFSNGDLLNQADTRQGAVNARSVFTQGRLRIGTSLALSERVQGRATPPGIIPLGLPGFGPVQNKDVITGHHLLGASATYAVSGWETSLSVGINRISYDMDQYEPTSVDSTLEEELSVTSQLSARLSSILERTLSPSLSSTTTVGADVSRNKSDDATLFVHASQKGLLSAPVLPGSSFTRMDRTTNGGFFVQEVLGVRDRVFLTGALRVESHSSVNGLQWAPRAGIAYLLNPARSIAFKPRVSFGKSIRPPTADQVSGGRTAFYTQLPSPDLRPEVQQGFDAGFDLEIGDGLLTLEATYFNQKAKNLIDFTNLAVDTSQYVNVGTARNEGLELGLRARTGPLDVTASYTYTKSRVLTVLPDSPTLLQPGDPLLYVPKHTVGGVVGIRLPSLGAVGGSPARLEVGVTYVGERVSDDLVGFLFCAYGLGPPGCVPALRNFWGPLEGFTKLRVGGSHPLWRDADLFLNVDNLTNDQDGEMVRLTPSRGRAIQLGIRFGQ